MKSVLTRQNFQKLDPMQQSQAGPNNKEKQNFTWRLKHQARRRDCIKLWLISLQLYFLVQLCKFSPLIAINYDSPHPSYELGHLIVS
jgi:hypothetical protein